MEELKSLLEKYLNRELLHMVISGAKGPAELTKVRIRPVLLKEELRFQAEIFRGTKAFHENLKKEEAAARISQWMQDSFRQLQLAGTFGTASVLVSKKGKVTIKEKTQNTGVKAGELAHNKKKHYLLEEGRPIDFLVDLGVMTQEGKVVHARYDKFRQINRFLEFIEDVLPALPRDREIAILDFGCGKSYLTFAMYYYLKICRGLDIRITGLDLKEDVILHCSELAEKYGYEKLNFLKGDIAGYEGEKQVDMVVTLHACDTATDYALFHAAMWNAKLIFSVPCCQHELNRQIETEGYALLTRYGIVKERFSALATDAVRANLLAYCGYKTQLLEFVDFAHTPKNLLIRAVKKEGIAPPPVRNNYLREVERMMKEFHFEPTLYRLLAGAGRIKN